MSSSISQEVNKEHAGSRVIKTGPYDEENKFQSHSSGAARLKAAWQSVSKHIPLAKMMFKGSLPMTVILAMYQSTSVAHRYTTVGYIISIIAFFSMAMLPRAKYFENLVFNIISTCLAASVSLLTIYCGIQARKHTTPPHSTTSYNSSQSAVCAMLFLANMWAAGTIRARIPLLQNTVYLYSVLSMIAMTYAPRFQTMDEGISLVVELLEVFFIAFAIATGVSLFIFPMTSRTVLFKKQTAYIGALRGFLKKQTAYIRAMEASELDSAQECTDATQGIDGETRPTTGVDKRTYLPAGEALMGDLDSLFSLHTQIYDDTIYAEREFAWGKLNSDDLRQLFKAFRRILTPIAGIKTIIEVFDGIPDSANETRFSQKQREVKKEKRAIRHLWTRVMLVMHGPILELAEVVDQGFEHAGIVLELLPQADSLTTDDVEARDAAIKPGDPTFSEYMDQKIQTFRGQQGNFLGAWYEELNIFHETRASAQSSKHEDQQNVYIILHLVHLVLSVAAAVLELVQFADLKHRDGTMMRNRLVFPSFRSFLGETFFAQPESTGAYLDERERGIGSRSDVRSKAKDPQHLPPRNAWERYSNHLRAIPKLLKSEESVFGMRIALATFSVGILAFLETTAQFYFDQKLTWTMIVIIVGMNLSSGESTFRLAARAFGSVTAMVISYIAWYIVDGKPAGVLVMTWLAFLILSYGFIKHPKYFVVWICVLVTIIAIIGSALQSKKLGHDAAIASGQVDYPIYLNAPYRLATVLGGCVVAYFWTLFPYPITDRRLLGRKLGNLLFLLAKFHDCGHARVSLRMRDKEGDMALKTSPGRMLQKVQHQLFHEIMTLLPELRMHALFQKYEFPIGGKFPIKRYNTVMKEVTHILSAINLLTHSTHSWPTAILSSTNPKQVPDTALLFDSLTTNIHHITSTLSLFSTSVKYGISLPPYFQPPHPVDFSALWEQLGPDIATAHDSERKMEIERQYSAWAILQIVQELVRLSVGRILIQVKELVGEIDFEINIEN